MDIGQNIALFDVRSVWLLRMTNTMVTTSRVAGGSCRSARQMARDETAERIMINMPSYHGALISSDGRMTRDSRMAILGYPNK